MANVWHGYLEVPLQELSDLGIIEKISSKSRIDSEHGLVYLEEDQDLRLYARAREAQQLKSLPAFYDVQDDFVRNLPAFKPPRATRIRA